MVTQQYHMMYLFVRYIVTHQLQICADPFFTSSNTFGKFFLYINFLSNCIKSCEITKVSHSLSKNTSNSKVCVSKHIFWTNTLEIHNSHCARYMLLCKRLFEYCCCSCCCSQTSVRAFSPALGRRQSSALEGASTWTNLNTSGIRMTIHAE